MGIPVTARGIALIVPRRRPRHQVVVKDLGVSTETGAPQVTVDATVTTEVTTEQQVVSDVTVTLEVYVE